MDYFMRVLLKISLFLSPFVNAEKTPVKRLPRMITASTVPCKDLEKSKNEEKKAIYRD